MTDLNIAIAGAGGRMGRILIEAVQNAPDARLSGALDRAGTPGIGADAAAFLGQPSGVSRFFLTLGAGPAMRAMYSF